MESNSPLKTFIEQTVNLNVLSELAGSYSLLNDQYLNVLNTLIIEQEKCCHFNAQVDANLAVWCKHCGKGYTRSMPQRNILIKAAYQSTK